MVLPQLEKHQNMMQVPEKIQPTLANGHLCKMDTAARVGPCLSWVLSFDSLFKYRNLSKMDVS